MSDNFNTNIDQPVHADSQYIMPSATKPGLRISLRPFRHTSFLVAAAVLLSAAIGLNASVSYLKLHFKKAPVPLRKSLTQADSIPLVLGPWVQVARQEVLNADMLTSLATNEF